MVSVEDQNLRGTGGMRLKNQIWDAAKTTIEEWTGMELKPTSMYGVRVYTEGAVLNPHVDRLPLVSSCIIKYVNSLPSFANIAETCMVLLTNNRLWIQQRCSGCG